MMEKIKPYINSIASHNDDKNNTGNNHLDIVEGISVSDRRYYHLHHCLYMMLHSSDASIHPGQQLNFTGLQGLLNFFQFMNCFVLHDLFLFSNVVIC